MGFDRTDKGHEAVIRGALDERCADCAVSPNARVAVPLGAGSIDAPFSPAPW